MEIYIKGDGGILGKKEEVRMVKLKQFESLGGQVSRFKHLR